MIKKSCLVARLQNVTLFLSHTKSCVWTRFFGVFFFGRCHARKHDLYINFFKKKKPSQIHFIMIYALFSRYEMFMQYYFILLCQPSTGTDNLQKLHCMQQNDIIYGGNSTLQFFNTIELNTLKREKKIYSKQ